MAETELEVIGLLQDPARRSLYAYVVAQGREVSRNEAAEAVGVQRTLAAFHLDRLAGAGLLDVTYRRLTARSGPGAGRPAKLYRRSAKEHAASLPPRDYAHAATAFAEAIERSGAEMALYATARERGEAEGRALAQSTGATCLTLAALQGYLAERGYEPYNNDDGPQAMAERGYEPYADTSTVRLRNCPFQVVAREFPVVTCGMNLALLEGLLEGGGLAAKWTARLDPHPGECCVVFASKTNTS